ncbi:arylsulfatase B-like isoform X2 [Malaya genurostris]|uniref:arylsulfatase B-like isoform X2 n=1 Tax=Malaya genurostris TaxID=325434 RepID=UPI0026F3E150|nr:arylsulfatase B-like isoform X2 [Malaya genurostris]XP_058456525.1 arylsulfatase B-like isoform X2 [Malaya genurostris]
MISKFTTLMPISILLVLVARFLVVVSGSKPLPNIIFILADDLGWNDVGFHGSSQIPTPNLDALAYSGIILNRYYVTPICTPSRAALMTGKYPIHTGMQHAVLYGMEPRGLPLDEKLLPEYLKELGYQNHIVGKWHLGHYKRKYTPLQRGFDSHVGFWTGHHHMFDHSAMETETWGLDMRRGYDVAYDLHGKYTTHVIRDEAVARIGNHSLSSPLFLYLAHAAVHSANPYDLLPAPDSTVNRMNHIENYPRRKFAAMLTELDESVGAVVQALSSRGMLNNTIIVFSSDNGGPAEGFNNNAASNWPLKGVKNTLWEGGVRAASFIWSPLLAKSNRVSQQVAHISDWLPTLLEAVGYDVQNLPTNLDGVSFWQQLQNGNLTDRREILHNIDDIWGSAALTVNNWKVVKGTNYNGQWDNWYGPAGDRDIKSYNSTSVISSPTGKALSKIQMLPSDDVILQLRNEATVDCDDVMKIDCDPLKAPCLFDVIRDPCEFENLAEKFPTILESMLKKLDAYNATAVPPGNMPLDSRGDPRFWSYTWHNFGDDLQSYQILEN